MAKAAAAVFLQAGAAASAKFAQAEVARCLKHQQYAWTMPRWYAPRFPLWVLACWNSHEGLLGYRWAAEYTAAMLILFCGIMLMMPKIIWLL